MNYYNPLTQERISHKQLCDKFNASIPSSLVEYNGWFKLAYGERPKAESYQTIKQNTDPELIAGVWTITYSLEEISIETIRNKKLNELKNKFSQMNNSATVASSLGFVIDANETANRNIQGLITTLEATGVESTQFCDHDNHFHVVTLADLKVMQLEVIQNGQSLYQQKWAYREAINAMTDVVELASYEIEFTNLSFLEAETTE